jgi:hypothetical protein
MTAGGCTPDADVWAETDSALYPFLGQGTATLHNDGPVPIYLPAYLPGCPNFKVEKSSADAWLEQSPPPLSCASNDPNTRVLEPGTELENALGPFNSSWADGYQFGAGTGRLRYSIGYDCQQGVPWSQCARQESVYSPAFTVEDCACPSSTCPTLEVLCTVDCPPRTLEAALNQYGVNSSRLRAGCGRRELVVWRIQNSDVYYYDEVTGALVGAIDYGGHDTPWGPCARISYAFGDTEHCADVVDCQVTGDPAVAANWTCPLPSSARLSP